ncbi:MarR family winged helix-turn-helix transcriptional regulator [Aurantiacibacter flavus]|uniref:MarR family winged helix-turn-helix transcriptional regulator n=1 Tax=Aurantiacibacter flavus TaxID=3145232 RepID=A0ABV0CYD5_9SPHN
MKGSSGSEELADYAWALPLRRAAPFAKVSCMFDLEEFIPYRLYQATEKSSQKFRQVYISEYGITRAEWRVLFNVGLYAPIGSGEIVERTSLDKSKISRAVQRLVDRKWLTRSDHLEDRRRHRLELTKEGARVLADLSARASEHNQAIIDRIGHEKARVLLQILCEIEAMDSGASHLAETSPN